MEKSRSRCPISCALDIFGDKWTLLIVRDMAFYGKNTYNAFLRSGERIASNILANRLSQLEASGMVTKSAHPESKASFFYKLTPKGIDLIPLLMEISLWSDQHLPTPEPAHKLAAAYRKNKKKLLQEIREKLESGVPLLSWE